ncbi:hypothetical protein IC374_002184 [Salmonella enterica]|nr:hypothetical protein [Salmonella enterica]
MKHTPICCNWVFPAPAGINRAQELLGVLYSSVPRASGDKPRQLRLYTFFNKCSPRQRG